MNSNLTKRLATVVGAAALVAGGAVITAPAAQADGDACAQYLANEPNNRTTIDGNIACGVGGLKVPAVSPLTCETLLQHISQVPSYTAELACYGATDL
ncbi:hypothetical protein [Streptomyces sp. NRRL B-1347]|uniref:hypothetical protein n=1 Tax=Streptomyces sp. NRRL B-1347 TaxID=1476877 RepID=UPI0004C93FA6|nr:hypothetical protein [Streptomyces sp. NRRL B-1347]